MGRIGELLVILAIVFMLFGTRRLKDFGSDLGAAIKGFKSQIGDDKQLSHQTVPHQPVPNQTESLVVDTLHADLLKTDAQKI